MNAQIIGTIIFAVVTCTAVFVGIYLTDIVKQKLPAHTRLALDQFATMAVQQVEQQNGTLSGPAKKHLAIASVSLLLKSFGLPAIPPEAIDIAIESAVSKLPTVVELNKTNG